MDSQLEIICHPNGENNGYSDQTPSGRNIPQPASVNALEKKLALFALRLAIIEKTASGLDKLAFTWATVVLGSFSSDLKPIDFWFVISILVGKGAQIFTHCRELQWLQQSTSASSVVPILLDTLCTSASPVRSILVDKGAQIFAQCRELQWLQQSTSASSVNNYFLLMNFIQHQLIATTCVVFSLMRLIQQDYGDDAQINQKAALDVCYSLALAGALMLFSENLYYAISNKNKLIKLVSEHFELDPDSLHRFFYNAYSQFMDSPYCQCFSQCFSGIEDDGISDDMKMDLASFAEKLLMSDSSNEQIIGARIFEGLVKKIGNSTLRRPVMKRLIEMLNWKDPGEKDIRRLASEIVLKLASIKQNTIWVATIPGATELIASLLHTSNGRPYEASPMEVEVDMEEMASQVDNPYGENNGDNDQNPSGRNIPEPAFVHVPEKKLAIRALKIAIFQKTVSGLYQLAFIWATVVLAGFASDIKPIDFWFITTILVIEAARFLTHSAEQERLQQSKYIRQQLKHIHHTSDHPIKFKTSYRDFLVFLGCITFSLMRLIQDDYGNDAQINQKFALNIFYSLALVEAILLCKKANAVIALIEPGKLIEKVSKEFDLGTEGVYYLHHFFCSIYSHYIDGSIFDEMEMDLISFAEKLLNSDSPSEQIIGANIFEGLVKKTRNYTLRTPVMKRLIEMLNWKDCEKRNIRLAASKVILILASKEQYAIRMAKIPGAMESIESLLQTSGGSTDGKAVVEEKEDYDFSDFHLLGLLILKRLDAAGR